MIHNSWVIDGRPGGLVIGRSHKQGNVYMLQEIEGEKFIIRNNLEGGEYVLSNKATDIMKDRLNEINNFKHDHYTLPEIKLNFKTRILNTHAEPNDKYLWVDTRGQFIVNKISTSLFFDELEEMNNKYNDFTKCDFNKLIKTE